ncbi:putative hydrolase of the HAD superfamily [Glaciihabitans tibetensis]|uniref:Putative hydrolase of the HAD superfamily n=1 Tax=Glaciihabitans tibetensis TaxID=1266600 RepID=A0A2T0VH97_9MICO|nr:HAD family hydrolase [Glaciihabitans tibetensis]PRY69596.1 putative hydrolase of the HAD superfamily [Glaciihabitans tibetensis]
MTLLFIFDMDHVLYGYEWDRRIAGLSAATGLPPAEVRARWWDAGREVQAEAGAFRTGDEYIAAFSDAMDTTITKDEWVRIRGEAMTPWPDSIAAAARARRYGQVTLLTNNGALVGESLGVLAPALAPVFGEHLLTSSAYGARKPDPQVFSNVLARYGIAAEDAFFADDLAINVAGAASIGISAHQFLTAEGMCAAIDEFAMSRGTALVGSTTAL